MDSIYETVRKATVIITGLNTKGVRIPLGSGFFVAPGLVLSCAHVVSQAKDPHVEWDEQDLVPVEVRCEPKIAGPDKRFDLPDVAVLQVDAETPCVPISRSDPRIGNRVWVNGITEIRIEEPETYASLLTIADVDRETGLFRLTGDRVGVGMSGGPVLDIPTFEVCGIFKSLESEPKAVGWAVTLDRALGAESQKIFEANLAALPDGLPALRARQAAAIEKHVNWVTDSLKGHAAAQAQLRSRLRGARLHSELVGDEAFPEWAARQLFELPVAELHRVLRALTTMLPEARVVTIFELVTCCLEGRDGSASWISASAAGALLREIGQPRPRAVRVWAKRDESAKAILRRAFFLDHEYFRVGGPTSADPANDTAQDLIAAYMLLAGCADHDEWLDWEKPTIREQIREELVGNKHFALVGLGCALDEAWFRELAEQFRGFPLMFRGPEFTSTNPDDMILDLQPPIDPSHERTVTKFRSLLARSDH